MLRGDGNLATGGRLGQTSGDPRQGRRDGHGPEPDERSGSPEPGHLIEEARSEEAEAGRALRRRADRTRAQVRAAEVRERALCRMEASSADG